MALSISSTARAAEPAGAAAGGSVSVSPAGASADANASKPAKKAKKKQQGAADGDDTPWIKRHRPTRNQLELGIYGGILLPSKEHELYNPGDPSVTWQPYKTVAPDIGLRFGYYPLSFLGLEIEGGVAPTKTATSGQSAVIGMFRGYGILQLPYRIAPFALIGYGLMGTSGLGKDIDPTLHFGGGVKFYVNQRLLLRLDVRDNATAQYRTDGGRTNHLEVLLGLSIVLNKKKPAPAPDPDSDGDGFKDKVDKCPTTPGVAPDGCPLATPAPEPDSDGDGFLDSQDACPQEPGVAPDGCPEKDSDGDGFVDSKDKCPEVPGVAPDGCPPPDRDKDGIPDAEDKCPDIPETKNQYQDQDGCADEVPRAVTKFTGVIKGIFFDVDKDSIKKTSRATLDNAVKVLKDFPDVKVEISGHTDSTGDRDHNIDLSKRRADAVKQYLVDKGIDGGRISTRGAGPDEPIADNKTAKGKSQNRRIEFKLQ
ncbi:OmpA family protein [Nannocystis pusilla]|uniref:OmpA family protein n=1 Tax=Nannocystis pusilla TaxID=889268 RepID=A0A9X3EZJ3_9BACT|nr:OmpA family protein [Nannocystis pusilla]MCY1013279.1 OmpA family protein [Nannocystis pusilla]